MESGNKSNEYAGFFRKVYDEIMLAGMGAGPHVDEIFAQYMVTADERWQCTERQYEERMDKI